MKKILSFILLISPAWVFAVNQPTSFAAVVNIIICLALDAVPIVILIAFVEFLRGLIKYVSSGDNEEKRTEGINFMIYGAIGFFVIVGVWGILKLSTSSFNISLLIPQFKSNGSANIDYSHCSSLI